jgi:putative endonuclease
MFPFTSSLGKTGRMKKNIGRTGEKLAARYLAEQGYILLEQNFHKRYGEIDIIARDGEYLVFIEVKTRSGSRYGSPFDAVDLRKQQQISKVALAFMTEQDSLDVAVRFDVVAVYLTKPAPRIELMKNAFECSS